MNGRDMVNNNRQPPSRIPVRFVDGDDEQSREDAPVSAEEGALTPEEIGRESSYEDETEVKRRIERGEEHDSAEGRERADDADVAGAPDPSDLPRGRADHNAAASHTGGYENGSSDDDESPRAPATASGPLMAELIATRSELRRVEAEVKKLSDERLELTDRIARRQADFENFRKRTERERIETYNRAVGEVVGRLLPVLDNLRRALDAEASFESGESEEFGHFLRGIGLIEKQLTGTLEGLGVEPVPTVGEKFDPHIHEAVVTEESDKFAPDIVMEELRRGYRLGDKLLRPAMVKVSK